MRRKGRKIRRRVVYSTDCSAATGQHTHKASSVFLNPVPDVVINLFFSTLLL
jgi:hypothetical protein